MKTEKIAVIGAGFAGLAMAARLKTAGFPYDQYESNDEVGGNWYNGMYNCAHTITSPKTMEFPDFPMPKDYPQFPSRKQIHDYLLAYTRHYNLRENLFLNKAVKEIKPIVGEQWQIFLGTGEMKSYKAVILANGHYSDYYIPEFPGNFSGEILHSKQYKSPDLLRGKRVLVVGAGCSGVDIAEEASHYAKLTHVSIRDTPWIIPKSLFGRNVTEFANPWMPLWIKRIILKALVRIVHGNYRRYGLEKPKHKIFEKRPTVNDSFLPAIKNGKIKARKEISSFNGLEVKFTDHTSDEYDLIIFATGYKITFPMMEEGIIPFRNNYPDLVYGTLSKDRKNMYTLGLGYPRYGIGPIVHANAELVLSCLKAQDNMHYPIGYLFALLGIKPFKNFSFEPHSFMRNCSLYGRIAPYLSYLENIIRVSQLHFGGKFS